MKSLLTIFLGLKVEFVSTEIKVQPKPINFWRLFFWFRAVEG